MCNKQQATSNKHTSLCYKSVVCLLEVKIDISLTNRYRVFRLV
jgi:hypothetical protein